MYIHINNINDNNNLKVVLVKKVRNLSYIAPFYFVFRTNVTVRLRPEEHIFMHGLVAFSLCCACWGGLDLRERGRISVR